MKRRDFLVRCSVCDRIIRGTTSQLSLAQERCPECHPFVFCGPNPVQLVPQPVRKRDEFVRKYVEGFVQTYPATGSEDA